MNKQTKGLFQSKSPTFGGEKGQLGGLPHLLLGVERPLW